MHAVERERTILSIVGKRGFVSIRELDRKLTASPATLRRDLDRLEIAGRIVRVHGGAKMPGAAMRSPQGVRVNENKARNTAAEAAIGKAAARLCSPGESIIIDAGSATLQMCPHLEGLHLEVVTNSLDIVSALLSQSTTRISMPAGALYRKQNILLSPFNDDGASHYFASKVFVGAASVSPLGLMQTDLILLQAERRLMARASQVILLVDSAKFRSPIGEAVCPLSESMTVITDDAISDPHAKFVEGSGARLITVSIS
jgi:DeoR family transcriptional regulator, ulaG and ulaABCDEF operon transcriptional repressor